MNPRSILAYPDKRNVPQMSQMEAVEVGKRDAPFSTFISIFARTQFPGSEPVVNVTRSDERRLVPRWKSAACN